MLTSPAGEVVYKGTAETMDSFQDPGRQVLAYRFTHADGSYIGRTSELPNLMIHLGGIAEKRDQVMMVRDTGDNLVLEVEKDPSQNFWVTSWKGSIHSRGVTGFADVNSVPMADPLFVSFLVSMQFRSKGLFSPFTTGILLLLLAAVVCYGVRRWRRYVAERSEAAEEIDLADLLPDSSPLIEQGCCAGSRAR